MTGPAHSVASITRLAAEVRLQLVSGLSVLDAVPFDALLAGVALGPPGYELLTRARPHGGLAYSTYAVTTCDLPLEEAWVWLNSEAWDEYLSGANPRSKSLIGHELGHVCLHARELAELGDVDAIEDHDARLDREAWIFCSRLLVPDQGLHRLRRLRPDEVAKRYAVTAVMASKRLEEFKRLSESGEL